MNLLIDTNIVIPLEPGSPLDEEVNTETAIIFHNLAIQSENVLCIHPAIEYDLSRDKDNARANIRRKLIKRYKLIPSPPDVTILPSDVIGTLEIGSNDYVDNCLLAAVKADAVDFLVTEDKRIHSKAERIGLQSRVILLQDALSLLHDLFDVSPLPPPSVTECYIHELNEKDAIFNSLREDYSPEFDKWLTKCKREHRKAYIIRDEGDVCLSGLVILKQESELPTGILGKTLKLCTFKVSTHNSGNRYGELLLKTICDYASKNKYKHLYFTAFSKQESLISFAKSFGFEILQSPTKLNENIIYKSLDYTLTDMMSLSPFEFHLKFGPRTVSFYNNSSFIVPIEPQYHKLLFPELEKQTFFISDLRPCGNSIRKAYLCHSNTKRLSRGDNILIYRSNDISSLTAIGVVEDILRSSNPDTIARYVGSSTVYRYDEIEALCYKPVLAIKFRFAKELDNFVSLKQLRDNHIINGQPQSIAKIPQEKIECVKALIKM
jgi:L-amino acid N-acyltransferase YncA/predicted RNA-binding protein with PUA-like domain/rRNA-processing protein FCF1